MHYVGIDENVPSDTCHGDVGAIDGDASASSHPREQWHGKPLTDGAQCSDSSITPVVPKT